MRHGCERADPEYRDICTQGDPLSKRDADSKTSERSRADSHGNPVQGAGLVAGLCHEAVYHRQYALRMGGGPFMGGSDHDSAVFGKGNGPTP